MNQVVVGSNPAGRASSKQKACEMQAFCFSISVECNSCVGNDLTRPRSVVADQGTEIAKRPGFSLMWKP
jgi:hypothetical protein